MRPTIGERLKELRIAKKLSQDQVSQIIGVASSTVSLYEVELRQPPYDILIRFARLYRVSTDYILGIDDRRAIFADGLTEPEIEAIDTLVALMVEKNKELNGD